MQNERQKQTANKERQYVVTERDLPLSCPMPEMELWNSHPRVFLPIHKTGHAACPYCGAKFILDNHDHQQGTANKIKQAGFDKSLSRDEH